jgi:hypothetical protein
MKHIAFFLSVLMIAPVFLFSQGTTQKNDTLNRMNTQGQKSGKNNRRIRLQKAIM